MMDNVSFKKGLLANLPAEHVAGAVYITTDERAMYLDVDAETRIRIGDFQEFASLAALQAITNPSTTALYYVTELNCLAKYDGTKFVQINVDTGATNVEVVGNGNAVTAASYDPATIAIFKKTNNNQKQQTNVGNPAAKQNRVRYEPRQGAGPDFGPSIHEGGPSS